MGGKPGEKGGQVADNRHMVAASPIYHVLAYDHAQAVAMIVPSCTFYLDVLAQHLKAQGLHGGDVIDQGFIRGRGVEAVRPVALVQDAHKEKGLVV